MSDAVTRYLTLDRQYARAIGTRRKAALKHRCARAWAALNAHERAEANRRWRDPS